MHILHRIQTSFSALTAAVMIAALIVVVPSPLLAQQSAATPRAAAKVAPQVEEEESSPASKKPGDEGIKVHGHWIIDVRNADGSLAEHRDFQNSLDSTNGANALLYLLSGQLTTGSMSIQLFGVNSGTGRGQSYVSSQAGATNQGFGIYSICSFTSDSSCVTYNLLQTASPGSYGSAAALTLKGQISPTADIVFNQVSTFLTGCQNGNYNGASTHSPADCFNLQAISPPVRESKQFTNAVLATPLTVVAGQSVLVTVVLSFS